MATASAALAAMSDPTPHDSRRRHSSPPNRFSVAATVSGHGTAVGAPVLVSSVQSKQGLARQRGTSERIKGTGPSTVLSNGGRGTKRLISRRHTTMENRGSTGRYFWDGVRDSQGSGGERAAGVRGFDAAPYQTTVLFRDR